MQWRQTMCTKVGKRVKVKVHKGIHITMCSVGILLLYNILYRIARKVKLIAYKSDISVY